MKSSVLPSLLVKTVATSPQLFVKAVQIFAKYLLEFEWNSNLLLLYQSFVSIILSCASDSHQLYPYTFQSLASLLLTFRDLAMFGRGEQVVEVVKNMFDMDDFNVKIVLLQFPSFVTILAPDE